MWAYQCMNSPLYMSDSGFGEFAFCIKVWNPATFGSFNSNKHQLLSCTSKFKIESQESDVQVWKWKVFWLVLDSPRWIPCNFGRAGKKANRAGTHCKRLYGSRARKRCTVDGAPPLSQHHKAVTVHLTLQMGSTQSYTHSNPFSREKLILTTPLQTTTTAHQLNPNILTHNIINY